MVDETLRHAVQDLIAREAQALDDKNWDAWLGLFTEDVEYWVPAWDSEHVLTSNPQGEMSLIYYSNRSGLEDRVFRLRTERSAASVPLPRTCHMTSNVLIDQGATGIAVKTAWIVHINRSGVLNHFFGRSEYILIKVEDELKIKSKKTVVMNDIIPTVMDIYSI